MDGAIAPYSADAARRLTGNYRLGHQADDKSLQAGLFEQILSLHTAVEPIQPPAEHQHRPSHESTSQPAAESEPQQPASEEAAVEEEESNAPDAALATHVALVAADAAQLPTVEAETTAPTDQPVLAVVSHPSKRTSDGQTAEHPIEEVPQETAQTEEGETVLPVEPGAELPDLGSEAPTSEASQPAEASDSFQSVETLEATSAAPPERAAAEPPESPDREASPTQRRPLTAEDETQSPSGGTEPTRGREALHRDSQVAQPQETDSAKAGEPTADSPRQDDSSGRREAPRDKWYQRDTRANPAGENTPSAAKAQVEPPPPAPAPEVGLPNAEPPSQANLPRAAAEAAVSELPGGMPTSTTSVAPVVAEAVAQATGTKSADSARVDNALHDLSAPRAARASDSAASTKAEGTADAGELSQQQRVRLVQRITRSFARLGPTGGSISIRLHPPQLGSLNVQVRLEGRSMSAKLSTETAAAREAVLESLPVLRGRLAEQGFEIAQFQVEVADSSTDSFGSTHRQSNPFEQGDQRHKQATWQAPGNTSGTRGQNAQPASSSPPPVLAWQTTTGIDLQA